MYICPICNQSFIAEEQVTKHSLSCWREHNPNHQSKLAPCSGNVHVQKMNDDIKNFFDLFKKE